MLNKCLDRIQRPEENVPRHSAHNLTSTTNFPHSSLQSPSVENAASSTVSSPPPEMPPLLNQPHWHATDKPGANASPVPGSDDSSATATKPLPVAEHALPLLPKLTIPGKSADATSKILIVDDNPVNRRVGSTPPAQPTRSRS